MFDINTDLYQITSTVNSQIIGMFLFGDFGICQMVTKLNVHQHKCIK